MEKEGDGKWKGKVERRLLRPNRLKVLGNALIQDSELVSPTQPFFGGDGLGFCGWEVEH